MTLRAIIKRTCIERCGVQYVLHETIDFECRDLEAALTGGGFSENACDIREIEGIEVLSAPEASA